MSVQKRRPLSYANVVATIALFLALGGAAYALGRNSVGAAQLRRGAVTTPKLRRGAVTGAKINLASLPGSLVFDRSGRLGPNQTASFPLGNFTLTQAANANGVCASMKLGIGAKASQTSFNGGAYAARAAGSSVNLPVGANQVDAVSDDASSTIAGQAGSVSVSGSCVFQISVAAR